MCGEAVQITLNFFRRILTFVNNGFSVLIIILFIILVVFIFLDLFNVSFYISSGGVKNHNDILIITCSFIVKLFNFNDLNDFIKKKNY